MKRILKLSILVMSILLASCSGEDTTTTSISNNNLSGTISGEGFAAAGGKAFNSGDDVSINITNADLDCNSIIFDYDLYISTTVPLTVGTYTNTNVVFHRDGETPLNYLNGTVIIEDITDNSITVKIKANSSSENTVEGRFSVDYCN